MPAQVKHCSGCAFFAFGSRYDDDERFKPHTDRDADVGECRIRSTIHDGSSAFPVRFLNDWCAEFKRAEVIQGYEANGHLTTG